MKKCDICGGHAIVIVKTGRGQILACDLCTQSGATRLVLGGTTFGECHPEIQQSLMDDYNPENLD